MNATDAHAFSLYYRTPKVGAHCRILCRSHHSRKISSCADKMSEVDASTKPVEAPSVEAPPVEAPPVEAPPVEQQQETSADAAAAAAKDDPMIKTTAQTDYKDVKKNNKFDPSVREVTDDPEAIRKQVRTLSAILFGLDLPQPMLFASGKIPA